MQADTRRKEHYMRILRYFLWSFLVTTSTMSAHAGDSNIQRFGMYVVVTDMSKSQEFYARLFQKQPYVKNDGFVGFDVAGGMFAAFAASGLDRKLTRGDNAVPYLRVKDIDAEFKRVKELNARLLDQAVVREGPISLFRFADPDGNVIEFFAVAAN
jgi:catechol 2,3-dioxygenase-like lactoylglutathione lyase family enzyme